jgi:ribosomal protein S6
MEKNNGYELSFWLSSKLDEKAIEQKFDGLLKQLEKLGALIIFNQSPQLKQLAYPIKNERNAYFGYIQYMLSKDSSIRLNEELMLNNDIIRFIILNKPKEEERAPRRAFSKPVFDGQKDKTGEKIEEGSKKEEKVISLEELDKKLSEILKEE